MAVKNIVNTPNKKILKLQGKEKLKILIENLNTNLIGKEDVIKTSLLSILAQENLILFGPPGTAKSEISRRISSVLDDGSYFEYLLTKFTIPEEIFGPLSISELKQDKFYRKTEGYLPTAQIGFLDEIFKANSSILNTLLTIMNEKIFHNGSKKEDTCLISLIGASNEDPSNDSELNALYDRFLVRKVVDYIRDNEIDELFNISGEKFILDESLKITKNEINDIEKNLSKITIPKDIREIIKKIRLDIKEKFKENNQEEISDRKLVKVLKLLKTSAYTNERDQIDISDVLLLKNCLWNNPENQKVVSDIIINNIKEGYKDFQDDDFVTENLTEDKDDEDIDNYVSRSEFDFKGDGTENNPFLIEDENDLIYIGDEKYIDKGYYFKQVNDITIASNWHSIGNANLSFKGNYNGNNKTISKLNNSMFFEIKESTVENLILKEVDINVKLEKVGSIANISLNSCIRNCSINGNISSSYSSYSYSGGVVGSISEGNIQICNVDASISSSSSSYSSYSGGVAGFINGGNIENCDINGNISSYSYSSYSYSGGVVGSISEGNIQISNVDASISSTSSSHYSYSGGVAGFINGGNIENCDINGNISSSSYYSSYYSYSGGVVGSISEGNIQICNVGASISSSYSGGITGSIKKGSIQNCSVAGDISSTSKNFTSLSGEVIRQNSNEINLKKNYINSKLTINNNKTNFNDENSSNGETLDSSQFNEKFYRRLEWDFKNIWVWDTKQNKPILKRLNSNSKLLVNKDIKQNIIKNIIKIIIENVDIIEKKDLSKILVENIWL